MARFLVVTDTPGIKGFVFGTDALAEVRGASALLDRLNRVETSGVLRRELSVAGGELEVVYANGGIGQFLIDAPDVSAVHSALAALSRFILEATGGEIRIAFGLASFESEECYKHDLDAAFNQMRDRRDREHGHRAISLLPFMKECESASHLPAIAAERQAGKGLILSEASWRKRDEKDRSRGGDLWSQWIEWLKAGDWPDDPKVWDDLRCESINEIGKEREAIGLVYADGNAMGRLVQELDSPEAARAFSEEIVDQSLRAACFEALATACAPEIGLVKLGLRGSKSFRLPADILLLGGDDLLVVLPAVRALDFTRDVVRGFEDRTRARIKEESGRDSKIDAFFSKWLKGRGLTISCGVALAGPKYPFYLLLDLAEELLKNAKRSGTKAAAALDPSDHFWSPAFVDFHRISSSTGHKLSSARESDYRTKTKQPRTLRPFAVDRLDVLSAQVRRLRRANFPRGKLHDLFEAALDPSPKRAGRRVREIFSRCKQDARHPQRQALWDAVKALKPEGETLDFPWFRSGEPSKLAIADLVEAYDLFPEEAP